MHAHPSYVPSACRLRNLTKPLPNELDPCARHSTSQGLSQQDLEGGPGFCMWHMRLPLAYIASLLICPILRGSQGTHSVSPCLLSDLRWRHAKHCAAAVIGRVRIASRTPTSGGHHGLCLACRHALAAHGLIHQTSWLQIPVYSLTTLPLLGPYVLVRGEVHRDDVLHISRHMSQHSLLFLSLVLPSRCIWQSPLCPCAMCANTRAWMQG